MGDTGGPRSQRLQWYSSPVIIDRLTCNVPSIFQSPLIIKWEALLPGVYKFVLRWLIQQRQTVVYHALFISIDLLAAHTPLKEYDTESHSLRWSHWRSLVPNHFRLTAAADTWLVEQGLTSHSTQFRSFWRRCFYTSDDPTNSVRALKEGG